MPKMIPKLVHKYRKKLRTLDTISLYESYKQERRKRTNKNGRIQSHQDCTISHTIITTNKNKEIKTKNNSSSSQIREFINSSLKEKYPDKPFEEIREELLNDPTAIINTDKQYQSMLDYRLTNWSPKQPKQPNKKNNGRKEIIPEHMKEDFKAPKEDIDQEEKKREIEEMLKKLRS